MDRDVIPEGHAALTQKGQTKNKPSVLTNSIINQ